MLGSLDRLLECNACAGQGVNWMTTVGECPAGPLVEGFGVESDTLIPFRACSCVECVLCSGTGMAWWAGLAIDAWDTITKKVRAWIS